MKSMRPIVNVPYWSFDKPTVAQRLKRPPPPGPAPVIVLNEPSNWNRTLLPPPMSSTPFIPHRLVPQSPLSAFQGLEFPVAEPFAAAPVGTPDMYSMPASRRPYSVTLL